VHNSHLPRYANSITVPLATPTDDTRDLLEHALSALAGTYRPGYAYFKYAVLLMDFSQRGEVTPDLFAPAPRRGSERLMAVIDVINRREGRGTVRLGSVPIAPEWGMRRDMKSQCYTTRWDELLVLRG
jgi:DNA polymerase V